MVECWVIGCYHQAASAVRCWQKAWTKFASNVSMRPFSSLIANEKEKKKKLGIRLDYYPAL
jgi:hypothetical protein